jgi:cyclase
MKNVALLVLSLTCLTYSIRAQEVTIRVTPAGKSVYMMDGQGDFTGGNIAVSAGDDGLLLVDNMFVAFMPKVLEKLKTLSDKPVRFAINTHYHGDHNNGNEILGSTATIIGHTKLHQRLASRTPALPPRSLPTITFSDSLVMHFNNEEIRLIHLPNGHTDNDVVVYFTGSKVIHTGDMFFYGMFPGVYREGGGDIRHLVVNLEKIVKAIPADAKVIPGHGDLATVEDLKNYITMLKETIAIVENGIKGGKTADQMIEQKALAKYDALGSGGAQTTEQYTRMLYKLLSAK